MVTMKKLLLTVMINVMIKVMIMRVMKGVMSPPPMSVVEGAEGAAQKMTAPQV